MSKKQEIENIINKTKDKSYRFIMKKYGTSSRTIKKYRYAMGITKPIPVPKKKYTHTVKLKYKGLDPSMVSKINIYAMTILRKVEKGDYIKDGEARFLAQAITGKEKKEKSRNVVDKFLLLNDMKLLRPKPRKSTKKKKT